MATKKRGSSQGYGPQGKKRSGQSTQKNLNSIHNKPVVYGDPSAKFEEVLIPKEDRLRLDEYLKQSHRSQKDWDAMKTILFLGGDLLGCEPIHPEEGFSAKDGLLYHEKGLHVFTDMEKLQAGMDEINKDGPKLSQIRIWNLSFEDALDISKKNNIDLYVNYIDLFRGAHCCAVFQPRTNKIMAFKAVPDPFAALKGIFGGGK